VKRILGLSAFGILPIFVGMSGLEVFIFSFVMYVVAIAIYDYHLVKSGKPSISRGMVNASRTAPIIAFILGMVVGILAGHFYWQFMDLK
jgi:VIT1/CCC1 family predicted Fe2+/Mn2+ transporter